VTPFTEAYDFSQRMVVDRNGDEIGVIDDVYSDQQGGQPEWALVHTGFLGTKRSFVPLRGAYPSGEDVRVSVDKQAVKNSPSVEPDEELSRAEERRLFEHYGIAFTTEDSTTAHEVTAASTAAGTGDAGGYDAAERHGGPYSPVRHNVSDQTTDETITRSEEELHVRTQPRESGRVRLRKYVVTEHIQHTVPVQREEVRIEREPITDSNLDQPIASPEISAEEHEVVLHEEIPVVEKRVVPKERVRLAKDTITDEEQVSETLRKEQIDIEDPRRRQ
jgi:uncharacterized protein (TIGR02271 family)